MTKPEEKKTRNPFRKEFWEPGHVPGDEILPVLKWVAIAMGLFYAWVAYFFITEILLG